MRAVLLMTMVFTLAAASGLAQQQALDTSKRGTNSGALTRTLQFSSLTAENTPKAAAEISVEKKVSVSGPLVQTFKVKRVSDVPRRMLHLINPFAPAERVEQFERTPDLSTRAWASTVGFHPGGSAFADATTHEPTMTLLSIGR